MAAYSMRIVGVKPRPDPVRTSELSECEEDIGDGVYPVGDGCCTWGRSKSQAHGKFSDLSASRSLDAQDERDRIGLGVRSVRVGSAKEGDETIAAYERNKAEVMKLVGIGVVDVVSEHRPVFTIGGRDYPLARLRVKRLVVGNGDPKAKNSFWS